MTSVTPDSHIYLSALEFGGISARLLGVARAGVIQIDTSEAILTETMGVLRDKFGWEGYRLRFGQEALRKLARVVKPTKTVAITDDPDDNRILECAAEAKANFIITNDKDLLRPGSYEGIPIIRAADFLRLEV